MDLADALTDGQRHLTRTPAAERALRSARGVGRPSTVAPFAPEIRRWLTAEPRLPGVSVLERARRAGYRGGKSALYDLVRRLRAR
jgi:hypothetical protein